MGLFSKKSSSSNNDSPGTDWNAKKQDAGSRADEKQGDRRESAESLYGDTRPARGGALENPFE